MRGEVRTSIGPVKMGISQAVHYGEVLGYHLGAPERRHYLVAGAAVRRLAKLQAMAKSDRPLLSRDARRRIALEQPSRSKRRGEKQTFAPALRRYLPSWLAPLCGRFEGEFRRAAVLFLETKGTRTAGLQAFYLTLGQALDRTDGILLKTDLSPSGTKWLCAFGIPQAHEEDPDRAARAALDVLSRVPKGLALRGGLHAGTVANIVVGTWTRRSFDVMGDVVNTAARAMEQAAFSEVLVTEATRKLLASVLSEPRGAATVKGKELPIDLHALKCAHASMKQLRVSAPMIGRDDELRQIVQALERAKAGEGSAIGIEGEPGIGKSRLGFETSKAAADRGFAILKGRSVAFGGAAYGAIAELLRQALQIPEGSPRQYVLERVQAEASRLHLRPADRHHLAEVLGARYDRTPLTHMDGRAIRHNNMVAIQSLMRALARTSPRLLLLEDMQWADEMTRDAVARLAREAEESPLVLLLLSRPGYEPPPDTRQVRLTELPGDAVDQMLAELLPGVAEHVKELVRERSDGNPLYIEEVARHLTESGIPERSSGGEDGAKVEASEVPDTLESLIRARLDRLGPAGRRVAQVASIIGRSFLLDILTHLPELRGVARAGIEELLAREICFEKVKEPRREYIFKHALTRDVAYASILASRRRRLHRAVAFAIEQLFPGERDANLALLGHHFREAGETARARGSYLAAARLASRKYAQVEAVRLYRAYLALVDALTEESIEGSFRRDLAGIARMRGAYDAARLEATAAEALLRSVGEKVELAKCLVERGLIALALDEGASAFLHEARLLGHEIGTSPVSSLGRFIAILERSLARRAEGGTLRAGLCLEDLPPGL